MDNLPEELIAHIAVCCDPVSVIRLSQTCRQIRFACYDSLVFQTILTDSQTRNWPNPSLDLDVIATHCAGDASAWARYAVADYRACELLGEDPPCFYPDDYRQWMGELSIMKHPFIYLDLFQWMSCAEPTNTLEEIFCLAVAAIASKDPMPGLLNLLSDIRGEPLTYDARDRTENPRVFLWSLCVAVTEIKKRLQGMDNHITAWHSANLKTATYLDPPGLDHIALANSAPSVPMPFGGTSWLEWFSKFGSESVRNGYISQDSWQGYYTMPDDTLEPSMVDIKFVIRERSDDRVELVASNCRDGVGLFDLEGTLELAVDGNDASVFSGHKIYREEHHSHSWSWQYNLKLTPLGFIGQWSDESSPHGYVWLWKA